jgi:transcriptional regulator with XRE-family HTH domain
MVDVNAASLFRRARRRSGLSLRALATRAGTSHSALAAYESGRKVPTVGTLDRVLRAAGFVPEIVLTPAIDDRDPSARGRELIEALELAAMFPARHDPSLTFPRFPT